MEGDGGGYYQRRSFCRVEIVSAVANERLLARLETGSLNLFRESIEVRT